ncbi:MAG: carbon storage regulator [bacterium]|nr:carbon storage regulator [Clostridium sp.]MCM1538747.1 carbon storage regulator [bacterium]
MLRLTVSAEEYLMIGDNVKIVFLGGSKNHLRIMIDAPKELNVVRNKVLEAKITDPAEKEKLPHYYAVPDLPERFRKKRIVMNDSAKKEFPAETLSKNR